MQRLIKMRTPCPFCGSYDVRFYHKRDAWRYVVACQCAECKAVGPRAYDYDARNKLEVSPDAYDRAKEKWERRYYEE